MQSIHQEQTVELADGRIKLAKDLKQGDPLLSVDLEGGYKLKPSPVSKALVGQKVVYYKVTTYGNRTLLISDKQKLFQMSGWKSVESLKRNQVIGVLKNSSDLFSRDTTVSDGEVDITALFTAFYDGECFRIYKNRYVQDLKKAYPDKELLRVDKSRYKFETPVKWEPEYDILEPRVYEYTYTQLVQFMTNLWNYCGEAYLDNMDVLHIRFRHTNPTILKSVDYLLRRFRILSWRVNENVLEISHTNVTDFINTIFTDKFLFNITDRRDYQKEVFGIERDWYYKARNLEQKTSPYKKSYLYYDILRKAAKFKNATPEIKEMDEGCLAFEIVKDIEKLKPEAGVRVTLDGQKNYFLDTILAQSQ